MKTNYKTHAHVAICLIPPHPHVDQVLPVPLFLLLSSQGQQEIQPQLLLSSVGNNRLALINSTAKSTAITQNLYLHLCTS